MSQVNRSDELRYLDPGTLPRNPAFSNLVVVPASAGTIYIGGQDAVDASGAVVGKGDIAAHSEQVFHNLEAALEAAGAGLEHLIKLTIYLVQGQPLAPGFEVYQRVWGKRPNPPTVSVVFVVGLANPEFLVEIDAVAVVS